MYVATFLDTGEAQHVGVMHRDGKISVVHVERLGDDMRVWIEEAEEHSVPIYRGEWPPVNQSGVRE